MNLRIFWKEIKGGGGRVALLQNVAASSILGRDLYMEKLVQLGGGGGGA